MKLLTVTIIPVISALILGGAFVAHDDYAAEPLADNLATDESFNGLRYIMAWDSGSFDEALWLAMHQVAALENGLPQHIESIQVEIQPKAGSQSSVQLAFRRTDLALLNAGAIAPELFLREYVRYQ